MTVIQFQVFWSLQISKICQKSIRIDEQLLYTNAKGLIFNQFLFSQRRCRIISMGQNQSQRAVKFINDGLLQGHWVILENCHVEESWLSQLDKIYLKMLQMDVNDDFRLWCITKPTEFFPITVIRNSIKLTSDPPSHMLAAATKHFSTEPLANEKFFNSAFSDNKVCDFWLKNVFSMVILHTVVAERGRYGSLGWNRTYDFKESDLTNCVLQFRQIVKQIGVLSCEEVHDFLRICNVGGRIVDDRDQRLLSALLRSFFNEHVNKQENYKFFEDSEIYTPTEPNKRNILDYLASLSHQELAKDVGLNENADILTNKSGMEKVSEWLLFRSFY